jgi:hypothetical protein
MRRKAKANAVIEVQSLQLRSGTRGTAPALRQNILRAVVLTKKRVKSVCSILQLAFIGRFLYVATLALLCILDVTCVVTEFQRVIIALSIVLKYSGLPVK